MSNKINTGKKTHPGAGPASGTKSGVPTGRRTPAAPCPAEKCAMTKSTKKSGK